MPVDFPVDISEDATASDDSSVSVDDSTADIIEAAAATDDSDVGASTRNYSPSPAQSDVISVILSGAADAALIARGFTQTP